MTEFYEDGPLKGMTSVDALIGVKETKWLKHVADRYGYSFDELVRNAVEETARDYARECGLLDYFKKEQSA